MISPGRAHDLKVYERLYTEAKTPQERNKWMNKIRTIRKESDNPAIVRLRTHLVAAHRSKDQKQIEAVSNAIYREVRK